jgi:plastocyanin
MLRRLLVLLVASVWASAPALAVSSARTIEIKTQKIGDAVHWMPEAVDAKAGETIRFVVKHELEGGFDFHGFSIPELKISKRVDRKKTLEFEVKIPAEMKEGSYKIGCQFHPAHKWSELKIQK